MKTSFLSLSSTHPVWQWFRVPAVSEISRQKLSAAYTPVQREILRKTVSPTVVIAGFTLTREELLSFFNGTRYPEDPALARALDVPMRHSQRGLLDVYA